MNRPAARFVHTTTADGLTFRPHKNFLHVNTRYMKHILTAVALLTFILAARAEHIEMLPYGNMDSWVTRNIRESRILGGNTRQTYAVGPESTVNGDIAYRNAGGSPWSSSNVMAKVHGITKVSTSLYPDARPGKGKCAKLTSAMEHCRALGIINIDVFVAGTMFLGEMIEPVKSTSDPYKKMEMGIPFTRRPLALVYDYRVVVPEGAGRVHSSGFGGKETLPGTDHAEVFIILQRRWEDAQGNLHAKRVGTGRELFGSSTSGWVNRHHLQVHYGDITGEPYYRSYMGLIPRAKSYCAHNSRGEMMPVVEEGWDDADATPTHLIVMFSAGSGEPFTGTPGLTLWVDNVGLAYPDSGDVAEN